MVQKKAQSPAIRVAAYGQPLETSAANSLFEPSQLTDKQRPWRHEHEALSLVKQPSNISALHSPTLCVNC
jgi:hypothetical protein